MQNRYKFKKFYIWKSPLTYHQQKQWWSAITAVFGDLHPNLAMKSLEPSHWNNSLFYLRHISRVGDELGMVKELLVQTLLFNKWLQVNQQPAVKVKMFRNIPKSRSSTAHLSGPWHWHSSHLVELFAQLFGRWLVEDIALRPSDIRFSRIVNQNDLGIAKTFCSQKRLDWRQNSSVVQSAKS